MPTTNMLHVMEAARYTTYCALRNRGVPAWWAATKVEDEARVFEARYQEERRRQERRSQEARRDRTPLRFPKADDAV